MEKRIISRCKEITGSLKTNIINIIDNETELDTELRNRISSLIKNIPETNLIKDDFVKRKRCKAGTRLQGNRCVPQTGTRKSALRRTGIKLKRAMRARGAGKKKLASLKRKITKKRVAGRARTYAGT